MAGRSRSGHVDDIVIDEQGIVDYVIISNDEKKLITVPWRSAVFDLTKKTALIDITTERFRQIPTYSRGDYPEFSTPRYRTQIDQYYGVNAQGQRIIKRGNPAIVK